MTSSPQSTARLSWRWTLAVMAVTLLVRVGVLWWEFGNLAQDPDAYLAFARNLVYSGVYSRYPDNAEAWRTGDVEMSRVVPSAYRPPLYPLLLRHCVDARIGEQLAIAALHLALGLGTVALMLALGPRYGLPPWGTALAALLVAFDPILLHHSTVVMTETLATLLAVVALFCIHRAVDRTSAWDAGLAGAALGLAELCRPAFIVWLAVVAVLLPFAARSWRNRAILFAAYLVGAAGVISPWAVRNYRAFGEPIITTTHGGYTLYLANNRSEYMSQHYDRSVMMWHIDDGIGLWLQIVDLDSPVESRELDADQVYYQTAFDLMRDEPRWFAWSCLVRVHRLWRLMPQRILGAEAIERHQLGYAIGAWYLVEYLLALAGIWSLGRKLFLSPWLWGVLLCASFTLVHTFYWSNMRMRAPLMPFVALVAAQGASVLAARLASRKRLPEKELGASPES